MICVHLLFVELVQVDYVTLPGWMTSTEGVRVYEDLPENARKYVELIEEKLGLPGKSCICTIDRLVFTYLFSFPTSSVDRRGQRSRLNDSTLLIVIGLCIT